ncbi:MAG: LysR family transcriptional regulator [Bacillota bacterium]|nr:LysR family transcriptional regulator [Bacillota bacterium]
MDIHVLKTFVAVCELSGFSAAAHKLGFTQSTVSSQIRQLEKELNTVLFNRYYHKIELTSDGAIVLKHARDILESHEKMISEIHEMEQIEGTIRLAMSSSVCNRYFKEDFLRFKEKYPKIHLIVSESGTEQMFTMLQKNEVDLVFTLDNHIYNSEYIICAEREEDVYFISSAKNIIPSCEIKELGNQNFILTEKDMSYRKLLDQEFASRSIELNPVLEIGNPLQICELVKNSNFLSFLPDFIVEEYVKNKEIQRLNVKDCDIKVWTQLLVHKNKWISPALQAFIEYYSKVMLE